MVNVRAVAKREVERNFTAMGASNEGRMDDLAVMQECCKIIVPGPLLESVVYRGSKFT